MFSPVQTDRVVATAQRQRRGQVETSLPAAAHVRLPSNGSVTIAGQRYHVSSIREMAWNHERVTVSILLKG